MDANTITAFIISLVYIIFTLIANPMSNVKPPIDIRKSTAPLIIMTTSIEPDCTQQPTSDDCWPIVKEILIEIVEEN